MQKAFEGIKAKEDHEGHICKDYETNDELIGSIGIASISDEGKIDISESNI